MPAPTPPASFAVRHPTVEDAAAVTELVRAFELDTDGAAEATVADTRADWERFDLAREAWIVEETASGEAVAFATLERHGDRFKSDGYVLPRRRGHGLGAFLLAVTEHAARVDARPATALHTGISMRDAAARALLAAHGYAPVRYYWQMTIELDGPPPAPAPPGVTIDPVDLPELRAFHAVKEAAFADHWGYAPEAFEDWLAPRRAHPGHDPGLWLVARHDGRIVGIAECSRQFGGGFVGALGVVRDARGRGIGDALLRRAFAELARRGEQVVRLGVDAANPTGATRLYERAGMRATAEYGVFEKPLGR